MPGYSLHVPALHRFATGNQIVTRWRVEAPHIRGVAILANEITAPVNRLQLLADILSQAILVMAFGAGRNGHVWFQPSQRGRFRYVDMTSGAFGYVLFAPV